MRLNYSFFASKEPHIIFTGKNALNVALFFSTKKRMPTPNDLYKFTTPLTSALSWGNPLSAHHVKNLQVKGNGVHAKIYTLPSGDIILSSQNNGASPLFEFAILYPTEQRKKRTFATFIEQTMKAAAKYSDWWLLNGKWSPSNKTPL